VTFYLADIASYQDGIRIEQVVAAGFGVNLKTSHGLGRKSVHPDIAAWATSAVARGLKVSTFHWLTPDAPGEQQAEYAFRQLVQLGLHQGTVHQLDVECEPAPALSSVRGYLTRMTQLLGRPVVLYTGDWWWTKQRAWNVSDLTPYLWSAPNAGYLGAYPGDGSPHWRAGYGGWADLAVMQYAVKTLPGTSIKVSMSAVRDESIWRSLTGTMGRPSDMSYSPDSIASARLFVMNTLRAAGETVNPASFGVVGDDSHANAGTGYHLGKDALKSTAYSIVESSRDRNGLTNAASAFDWGNFSITVKGKRHDLKSMSLWMVAQCKAGAPDTRDLREIIYSPDGSTVKRWDDLGIRTTGDSSHTSHTHFSWYRDSEKRDKTALFRRYFISIGLLEEPDMPIDDDDVIKIATAKVWPAPSPLGIDGPMSLQDLIGRTFLRANGANDGVIQLRAAFTAFAAAEQGDDAAKAAALAQLRGDLAKVPAGVVDALGGSGQTDAEIASALRAALGDRAAAVKALL
jgi:hypothetical protein